jgi:MFS family permease
MDCDGLAPKAAPGAASHQRMRDEAKIKWPKWALAMLFLVDGAGFGTWAAHVPVFKQFLHIENGSLTLVLISVIIGAIVTMPLTGQLIARYGSRRVIRVTAIGYVLIIGLLAQASSFLLLVLFAGLFGTVKGAFDISVNAQAMAVEKHYRKSSMSFFQVCWSAGGLLGAGAASLMLQHHGTIRADLSIAAGLLGLCSILALPLLVNETVKPRAISKLVWPNAALLRIAALGAFGLLAEGAIADWASVYLHSNVGVTLSLAAAGYAAYAIAMAAARFSGDWLAQRFSGKSILHGSGLLIASGLGCTLLSHSWWPAVAGLMLAGIGVANIVPVIWGVAGRDTKMGAGPAISATATIGYCGFLIGPPIIGSLAVLVGLRVAMGVIVLAGIFVAVGPMFFPLESSSSSSSSRPANEKAVTTT